MLGLCDVDPVKERLNNSKAKSYPLFHRRTFPAPREAKSCGTEMFPAPPQTESLGPELTGPGPECTMLCSIDRPEGPNVNNLVNCAQGPNAQYSGQLTGPEGPGREFTPRYAGATLGGKLPFRVRSGLKKSTNNAVRGALLAKCCNAQPRASNNAARHGWP